jgi:SAM-dependent methyltransferase
MKHLPDRHYFYAAAVQNPKEDLRVVRGLYELRHNRPLHTVREDFCGTALIASEWVGQSREHHAWAVDLDPGVIEWGRSHYAPRLGAAARRLSHECADALTWHGPRVQATFAFNTSYSCFKSRPLLREYFENVRRGLEPGGLFVLDATGGTDVQKTIMFRRRVPASTAFDGTRIPEFTYVLDQETYDPETNETIFNLSFHRLGRPLYRRAFRYDYRHWQLPELKELLVEAGFRDVAVYAEGWCRGLRRPSRVTTGESWMAYVTGWR